jgi:citrate synthase
MSTTPQAVLSLPDGRSVALPLLKDSSGADFLDVRKLYGDTGLFTFDPGFTSTASCESTITYIDGAKGILLYRGTALLCPPIINRVFTHIDFHLPTLSNFFDSHNLSKTTAGYPIEQLARDGDLVDCTYLLLNGELPTHHERRVFLDDSRHRMVHERLIKFYQGFKSDAHPMAIMVGVVGAMSSFYDHGFDIHSKPHRVEACMRVIGKMPTLAAMAYKTSVRTPLEPFICATTMPRGVLSFVIDGLFS